MVCGHCFILWHEVLTQLMLLQGNNFLSSLVLDFFRTFGPLILEFGVNTKVRYLMVTWHAQFMHTHLPTQQSELGKLRKAKASLTVMQVSRTAQSVACMWQFSNSFVWE